MLRKHASLVIAMSLIALVATACILRTRPAGQTSQPVMVEKHKEPKKHKEQKHKDPHDNGHGHDDDKH